MWQASEDTGCSKPVGSNSRRGWHQGTQTLRGKHSKADRGRWSSMSSVKLLLLCLSPSLLVSFSECLLCLECPDLGGFPLLLGFQRQQKLCSTP